MLRASICASALFLCERGTSRSPIRDRVRGTKPWQQLASARSADGVELTLRGRGDEYLICAGGRDLMSTGDEDSSRALAALGCEGLLEKKDARVLVGGLGMGYTLAEALRQLGENAIVEVAELVPCVVEWSREYLGYLSGNPLDDPRTVLHQEDVALPIGRAQSAYDAIMLDVDNGPDALAHEGNMALYGPQGLRAARRALRPGGVFAVWSFSDDPAFTRRLGAEGFEAKAHRVSGSRRGRGRYHWIWIARPKKSWAPPR